MRQRFLNRSIAEYFKVAHEAIVAAASLAVSLGSLGGVLAARFGFKPKVLEDVNEKIFYDLTVMLVSVAAGLMIGYLSQPIVTLVRRLSGTVRVFISYPHSQRDIALQVTKRLRHTGVKVWIDAESIRAGDRIHESIVRAIKNADVCVYIVPSKMTDFSHKELSLAFKQKLRIIPVVTEDSMRVPEELADISNVSLVENREAGVEQIVEAVA
jgi:TIR domain